jgi:hypothetical protein
MGVHALARGATIPALLLGARAAGALTLGEHLGVHGRLPTVGRASRSGSQALIEEVEAAGVLGRGGGAFATAAKMRAVADAAGGDRSLRATLWRRRPIVVVNGAEGQPASVKDETLLQAVPHLVLDGASLAARALGADEATVAVCARVPAARESVARARRTPRRAGRPHAARPVRWVCAGARAAAARSPRRCTAGAGRERCRKASSAGPRADPGSARARARGSGGLEGPWRRGGSHARSLSRRPRRSSRSSGCRSIRMLRRVRTSAMRS